MGVYYLLDYTAPRGMPFWRPAFGILLLINAFIFILEVTFRNRHRDLSRIRALALAIWFALLTYWIAIPSIIAIMGRSANEPFYITYFLGDLAQIIMLFIGIGLGILWSSSFQIKALSMYLLAAALVAPISANKLWGLQYHWVGRFDPPHVLLISASAAGIMCASRGKDRLIWLIAALGMILLAALSGMRTILFLALLSLVFVATLALFRLLRIAVRRRQRAVNLIILSSFISAFVAALALIGNGLLDSNNRSFVSARDAVIANLLLKKSRLTLLLNDGIEGDESLLGRMLEVLDVTNQVAEDCVVGNVARCIFGRGHGATFEAEISHPGPNITPEGRVHNVHFGPALLVFRYGLPGLLGYISMLILGLYNLYFFFRHCSAACARRYRAQERRQLFVFGTIALALVLSTINFTMRTILVDPLTGLILGLNIGYFLQTRSLLVRHPRTYDLGKRLSNA